MIDRVTAPESSTGEMSLKDYATIVRRRGWIVALAVIAAALGSLVMSAMQERIYEADAQMLVNPRANGAVFDQSGTTSAPTLERAINTEIRVIEGQQVRARVQRNLGLDSLPPTVDAASLDGTDVVALSVRSADPVVAQQLADAYIDAYVDTRRDQALEGLDEAQAELAGKVDELQGQIDAIDQQVAATPDSAQRLQLAASLAGQRQALVTQQATFKERLDQMQVDAALTSGGASVVQSAELPSTPVAPKPVQTLLLACAIGLMLGLAAAFLAEYVDDSVRTQEDLERLTVHPVLAVVPVKPAPDARPLALSEPYEPAVEPYRGLRTNIMFLALDAPLRSIQVTSSLPGEGKTTTAANLAIVLAQAGGRVVIVDADLRRPRVHEVFGVAQTPGLTDILLGEPVELVAHVTDTVDVITAGSVPPNPSEMLSSPRLAVFLRELAERYDHVIVDSAPVLPVSDSVALSRTVDGVLMVTQSNRTSRRNVGEALERLDRVGSSVIGVVLNRTKRSGRHDDYGYAYGYGYSMAAMPVDTAPDPAPGPPSAVSANGSAPDPSVIGERQ
ncbi:MAG: polysaccharide biosynthesis tyrosine autokinase [Ilumatobacteraceae bacterium]